MKNEIKEFDGCGGHAKDSWRNWQWNQLRERVTVHPRDAIVLYLAEPDNADYSAAIKRGFSSNNLIAVTIDPKICEMLRASGQLCIYGDIFQVIRAWPIDLPISAVVFDFYCALEKKVSEGLLPICFHASMQRAVVSLNCLRGREHTNKNVRLLFDSIEKRIPDNPWLKHRGFQFWAIFVTNYYRWVRPGIDFATFEEALTTITQPKYNHYPSEKGNQKFDSIILSSPARNVEVAGGFWKREFAKIEMVRQVAAVLAHRTRRAAA